MEGFRFSDFKGTGSARATPRGEWLSESGSLYPTLDIANLVDVISDNIRAKAATMTGYKDPDAQVPALMRLFRLNGSTGPTLTFEEFVNTLSKLNVIGLQHGVSALFDRYDFEGTGTIVTEQFVTMLLRCVPDCNGALELRNSFATIRRACRAAGGLHGLRRLVQSLERRSRSGLLRRGDLADALLELGAYVKDGDVRPVLVAYDASGAGAISLPELVFGLRGCLPRPRRLLAERTWQTLLRRAGMPVTSGSIDIDTLAAAVDTSCALFTTPPALHATSSRSATARLAASARSGTTSGRPGTAAPSTADFDLGGGDETDIYAAFGNAPEVSAAGFLAYMQDVSPLLPRDSEFIKLLNDAFGVDAHMDRSALVKPGSVEDLLRTGRGAHGIPEYTAVGRMPTPGLLGGKPGVPGLGGVAGHAVAGTPAAAGGYGADSRYGLHSSARLAASLGGRHVAADPAAAAAAAAAATGGASTSAWGAAGLGITGGYAGASVPLPGHGGHGGHSHRAASAAPAAASSPYSSYGHGHGGFGGFGASDGPSAGAPVARNDGGATALATYAAAARAKAASGVRPSTAMPALGSPRMHLSLGLGGGSAGGSKAHSPASSYGGASDHGHGLYGSSGMGVGAGAAAMPTIGEGSPASTAGAGSGAGWPGHSSGLGHSGSGLGHGHASHGARPMTAAPAFGRSGGFGASGSGGFGAAAASSGGGAGGGFGVVGMSFAGPSAAGGGSGSGRMGVREAPAALGSSFGGGSGPSGEPVAQGYSPAGALSGLAIGNSTGGFGASGSPAGGAATKMRPHTAGPRIVLAPQLARSLGRATLRF